MELTNRHILRRAKWPKCIQLSVVVFCIKEKRRINCRVENVRRNHKLTLRRAFWFSLLTNCSSKLIKIGPESANFFRKTGRGTDLMPIASNETNAMISLSCFAASNVSIWKNHFSYLFLLSANGVMTYQCEEIFRWWFGASSLFYHFCDGWQNG